MFTQGLELLKNGKEDRDDKKLFFLQTHRYRGMGTHIE